MDRFDFELSRSRSRVTCDSLDSDCAWWQLFWFWVWFEVSSCDWLISNDFTLLSFRLCVILAIHLSCMIWIPKCLFNIFVYAWFQIVYPCHGSFLFLISFCVILLMLVMIWIPRCLFNVFVYAVSTGEAQNKKNCLWSWCLRIHRCHSTCEVWVECCSTLFWP